MSTSEDATESGSMTQVPQGSEGKLTVPSGDELPVRTVERGEDVVLVVLADIDEYLDSELEPSLLEYASVRGMVRLRGEAVFEDKAVVRFRARGEAEVIQRRAYVRVHTPQVVKLAPDAAGRKALDALTVDLSGGGMLLTGAEGLETGAAVRFAIQITPGSSQISGVARVVRIRDDGKRALMFEQIEEGDRQRLIRFVFACMRSARAKTRGDWF